ncbi:hypothetical protein GCM10010387_50280 [Streptomyces inusitatus]|uniref:Ricin B lectin domain-containing protein n=1 Tax=Streptomyces inusitatus TaxID=68221 RepID=A0A918QJZ2_9ACTN|nr:RICIN domain-containing protein [Streptomyces inusitatus]GGZ49924.1 hypothetical protein GCM10010387_50280 [Streptomyces inusitatus]
MIFRRVTSVCATFIAIAGLSLGATSSASAENGAKRYPAGSGLSEGRAVSPADATGWRLQNFNSGQCAVARGGAESSPVVQFPCGAYDDQGWTYPHHGGILNQIANRNSGKCIVVRGSTWGNKAVQSECNAGYADQIWEAHSFRHTNGETLWYFLKRGTDLALTVQGGSANNQLIQANYGGYADQWWRVAV